MGRHIRQIPLVPIMDLTRRAATGRALGPSTEGMGRDYHFIRSERDIIHDKALRQQLASLSSFGHEQPHHNIL